MEIERLEADKREFDEVDKLGLLRLVVITVEKAKHFGVGRFRSSENNTHYCTRAR